MSEDIKERLGRIAGDAAQAAVETSVEEAQSELRRQADETLEPIRHVTGQVSEFVRERPLAAVMMAASAGFMLAWLRRA